MKTFYIPLCVFLQFTFAVCDLNSADDSGIGLVVSLFSPGHLSLIPGNPEKMNLSRMTERSSVSIKTFNFNTVRAKIVSMAANPQNNTLFILDSDSHSIYRMENFSIWLNNTINIVPLHKGVSKTSAQIAYDWRSQMLYWVDGYYNWIAMQPAYTNDNTMYKVIIRKFTKRPEGLTIDPLRGYLFWSDMGSNKRIERCNLIGEDRVGIVTRGIGRVYDISADTEQGRIYWVDASRHTIESSDYSGRSRRIIVRMNSIKFTSITVFGKYLYVASFTSNTVSKINKETGEVAMVILVDDGTPVSTEIYDPTQVRPVSIIPNACAKADCMHFCVETPTGARCVCKEGFYLFTDNRTCGEEYYMKPGLLVGNSTHICHIDIRLITALKDEHKCFSNLTGVRWLVADAEMDVLFYVNTETQELTEYYMPMNQSTSLTNTDKNVTGLTYDWIGKNVFWSDGTGNIKAYSIRTSATTTLFKGRDQPVYLQANPLQKKLYWIEGRKPTSRILVANMDGTNATVLVNSSYLHSPTGLYYEIETDRLFWINWHSIKSVKSDGTDPKSFLNIMAILFFGVELMMYKDYAIWTHGRNFISTASIHKSGSVNKLNMTNYQSMTAMAIFDPNLQMSRRGPCDITNGGCDHICLPSLRGTRKCKCDFGFYLASDGKSCVTDLIDNNFILAADYTHGRIYQISLLTHKVSAINLPEIDRPASVALHKTSNTVYWIEIRSTGSRIRKGHLNGTDVTELYTSGLVYPDRVAIDFTTGNLYFTAVSAISMGSYVGVLREDTGDHKRLVTGLYTPRAIALVPDESLMFWTDHHKDNAHVGRSYMDGSDVKTIVSQDITWPNGLAVDYKAKRVYWSDGNLDKIESIDYDGKNRLLVLQQKDSQLVDIALMDNHIYFTAWNKQKIQKLKINSDGTGTLVNWMDEVPEFGRLDSIDVYPGQNQRVNNACKKWNGGCSTFCLPNKLGRACACSDEDELLSRGMICDKANRCESDAIPHVIWEAQCEGFLNRKCNYTCKEGTVRNPLVKEVLCNLDGEWETKGKELCYEKTCPVEFPVANLLHGCSQKVNSTCGFKCIGGFYINPKIPTITCLQTGQWDHEMHEICIPPPNLSKYCKETILYGSVSVDCSRIVGSTCPFTCDKGYIKKDDDIELHCLNNGLWNFPVESLCTPASPGTVAAQKSTIDNSSALYAGIGGTIAAFVVIIVIVILVAVFFFIRKRRNSQVGRYETQHNVYCEPDKGVVNIGATINGTSDTNNTYSYATMSDT